MLAYGAGGGLRNQPQCCCGDREIGDLRHEGAGVVLAAVRKPDPRGRLDREQGDYASYVFSGSRCHILHVDAENTNTEPGRAFGARSRYLASSIR